jgi:hypothetical protein
MWGTERRLPAYMDGGECMKCDIETAKVPVYSHSALVITDASG